MYKLTDNMYERVKATYGELDWYIPKDIFIGHLEEKTIVFLHKSGNSYHGKVDCIDYEDASIHLENDA